MIEDFEYYGKWWFPERPEKSFSGILKYHPNEGPSLKIPEINDEIDRIFSLINSKIILGETYEKRKITLFQSSRVGNVLYPEMIFINEHFKSQGDIKFNNLFVEFSYLKEWLDIISFEVERGNNNIKKLSYNTINIPFEVELESGYKISAFIKTELKNEILNFKGETFIRIIPEEEKDFDDLLEIVNFFQYFLNFSIDSSVTPLKFEAMRGSKSIIIIYSFLNPLPDFSNISEDDLLIKFSDIKENIKLFFDNWYRKSFQLKPVADLFLGTLMNPHMYVTTRFLNLMSALESYYVRTLGNLLLNKPIRKQITKEIIKQIPKSVQIIDANLPNLKKLFKDRITNQKKFLLKEWMKDKIADSNRISIRDKIKIIFEKYSLILDEFFYEKEDFVNRIVILRNYFTHYSAKSNKSLKYENILHIISELLGIIVRICLLNELGLELIEIKGFLLKNSRIRFVLLNWIIRNIVERNDCERLLEFIEKNFRFYRETLFHLGDQLEKQERKIQFFEKFLRVLEENIQWGMNLEENEKKAFVGTLIYLRKPLGLYGDNKNKNIFNDIIKLMANRFEIPIPFEELERS